MEGTALFGPGFDIVMAAITGVCAILLLIGKGEFILTLFAGKSAKEAPLPYEKNKLCKVSGIMCIPVCLMSLGMIFFPENKPVAIAGMVLIAVVWVVGIWYLRKYAKVEPEKKDSIQKRVKKLQKK